MSAAPEGSLPPRHEWESAVGAVFHVADADVDLTLAGVDGPSDLEFTIQFEGPAELVLAQAILRLSSEPIDGIDLFLVPLGVDAGGARYEAVFSLRPPPD